MDGECVSAEKKVVFRLRPAKAFGRSGRRENGWLHDALEEGINSNSEHDGEIPRLGLCKGRSGWVWV